MPRRPVWSAERLPPDLPMTDEHTTADHQRRANLRLGLILASVALAFAVGFVAKMAWF